MKKIILDTDLGSDCDDAGALALLYSARRAGLIDLLAVTLSTGNPWAAACAEAIGRHYGARVPLGAPAAAIPGEAGARFSQSFAKTVAEKYGAGRVETVNSVSLLRRTLAANEGVILAGIGPCTNLAALLQSRGDGFSPLSGEELLAARAKCVVLMGGYFPRGEEDFVYFGGARMEAEWNILQDVPAARLFFENCPVPVVVADYLLGEKILTGGRLLQREPQNPAAECYRIFCGGARSSWDPVVAFYAVYGESGCLRLSPPGHIHIGADGVSVFEEKEGGGHRLLRCADAASLREKIDAAMCGQVDKK